MARYRSDNFRIRRNTGLGRMAAGVVDAPVLFRNAQALRVGIAGVAEPRLSLDPCHHERRLLR